MSQDSFDNKSPEFISEMRICRFLLHPIIRSHVISSLSPWMFTNNATKAIADSLSKTVFDGNEVDKNHLVLYIKQHFKTVKLTKDDFRHVLDILQDESKVRLDDIKIIVHTISEFIKSRLLAKGAEFYSRGNEEEAIKYFQDAGNFTLSESPFIDPSNEDLVMKLKELSFPGGKVIKSSIALYNDSSVYKGFKYGDLIMVCAPPKVGKTTLLCQEGAYFCKNNIKVAHVCLGDMDNIDVICKYISHLTGDPMEVIIENPVKYFTEFPHIKEIIKNVRISCFPAGELGVKELLGHLRQLKQNFNFDAVIVDYDSNIAPPKGENMYEVGGIIYTALKGFAEKERCVLFVGSQPKINFWETEKLDMSSASESSRKQHTIDAMITMGRNKDCKHLGTYNIACMRRGSGGVAVRIKFDYKNSTIKEISQNEYDKILNEYKRLTNDKLTTMGSGGGEGFNDSLSK